jgi:hypothetical protein
LPRSAAGAAANEQHPRLHPAENGVSVQAQPTSACFSPSPSASASATSKREWSAYFPNRILVTTNTNTNTNINININIDIITCICICICITTILFACWQLQEAANTNTFLGLCNSTYR